MYAHKIHVGVLRGGPSSEYDVSLKTGGQVLKSLPERYLSKDIFIDKEGVWHMNGIARDPGRILQHVDVVFNALHGEYGEDGKVQRILENFAKPYTGSTSLASAIAMNKILAKKRYLSVGLKTPAHIVLLRDNTTQETLFDIYRTFPSPMIVKPIGRGSSVGVFLVSSFRELLSAVEGAFEFGDTVLVEEFIKGREATCGVVEAFRDKKAYALLPVEIIKPSKSSFFDYDAKYGGETQEVCPANLPKNVKEEIQMMAQKAHEELGLRHYSRSDFMYNPTRGIYILETNSLPGLTEQSLLPKSLAAIGSSLPQFLDHVISLALRRK